jgi:multisubunit Na+/H+ antiporter MnhF subunit
MHHQDQFIHATIVIAAAYFSVFSGLFFARLFRGPFTPRGRVVAAQWLLWLTAFACIYLGMKSDL